VSFARLDGRRQGLRGPEFQISSSNQVPVSTAIKVDDAALAHDYGPSFAAHAIWLVRPSGGAATWKRLIVRRSGTATILYPSVGAGTLITATASPTASDGSGTFAATSLKPSSSWQVSAQTGGFSWSYPLRTPPAAAGPAPDLALTYDSQAVDGETGATNNQPSDEGDGWSVAGTGFVERSFTSCGIDDGPSGAVTGSGAGDLCWKNDNATMSFGGYSGQLLPTSTPGTWRLSDDDGSRIQHLTLTDGRSNGTYDNDYWVLTTTDGTRYFFGLGQLPGAGWPATQSAWTVPVFGNDAGEPCHGATFASSSCTQAWRWNLDYVVDPHGNAEAAFYTAQTNHFTSDGSTYAAYTRGGTLNQISYGLRDGAAYTTTSASDKVIFSNVARCDTTATGDPSSACDPNSPTAADWPDTPWYLNCTSSPCSESSPSFFSTSMLSTVTTAVYTNGAYYPVDVWTLTHTFPSPGSGATSGLWLSRIDHAGKASGSGISGATTVTDPSTVFHQVSMNNRVVQVDGATLLPKLRIASIDTAQGGQILVNYSGADCTASTVSGLDPANNTHRCFPQWWTPPITPTPPAQLDWFNKFVVTSVEQTPVTGGPNQIQLETDYEYLGNPAWRFDTAPGAADSQRTWSVFAGYQNVEVRDGNSNSAGLQHTTDYTFFQGLDGDPNGSVTNPTSSHRTAAVGPVTDSPWWAGRVYETVVRNGSSGGSAKSTTPVISDTVTVPWASSATASAATSYTYTDPPSSTAYSASFTTEAHLTGDSSATTTSPLSAGGNRVTQVNTSGYDSYGRATQVETITPDAGSTCTRTSYATNPASWLISYPSEVAKVGVDCSTTPVYPGDAISDTQSLYDGASAAAGQTPVRGDVTQTNIVNGYTGTTADTATWLTTAKSATTDYDALGRQLKVTDQLGRVTLTSYTPATSGPLTSSTTTNPMGWTSSSSLNPAWGVPVTSTDVNGFQTTYTWDAMGRAAQMWTADWTQSAHPTVPVTSHTYTLSATQPSVVTTTAVTATGGSVTSYSLYDGLGRLVQTQSPAEGGGSDVVDTTYDGDNQTATVTAPYAVTSSPSASLVTPLTTVPSTTETLYDGAGRTTATVLLGTTTEQWRTSYAYYGTDRVDMTPPSGGTPTSTFTDSDGHTVKLVQYLASAPQSTAPQEATTYGYDARGDRTAMTDPAGNTWGWKYDALGRVYSAIDPDAGTTTTGYDTANRVISTTDQSRVTLPGQPAAQVTLAFKYDALDRKTGEYSGSTSGTQLAAWTYDPSFGSGATAYTAKGQLASSTRFVGSNSYTTTVTGYDPRYRQLGQTVVIPGTTPIAGSYTTSFTWGPDGSPLSQTDPAAGGLAQETLNWGYDTLDNPTGLSSKLGAVASSISFTNLGQVSQVMQLQGAQTWRTNYWDPTTLRLDEVKSERNATANTIVSDDKYGFDNAGNITSDTNTTNPTVGTDTQCFSYDNLRELTAAWTPASNSCATSPSTSTSFGGPAPYWASWSIDPATGNRLSATTHALTSTGTDTKASYTYNAGQPHAVARIDTATAPAGGTTYTTTGTNTYSYDGDGDTTARLNQTMSYTPDGHFRTVTIGNATSQPFVYNADGNLLIGYDTSGASTLYLGDTEVHLASGATSASATRTYTLLGMPLVERDTTAGVTGSHAYLLDPNVDGTVTAYVDTATAAVTRRYEDPYGNQRGASQAWIDGHTYLNKNSDATTGLVYVGARAYDPSTGRFLTVDPVLDPSDPLQNNPYAYSHNTPVTSGDPTGLQQACEGPCSGAADPSSGGGAPRGMPPTAPGANVSAGGNPDECADDCANRPGRSVADGAGLSLRHNAAVAAAEAALSEYTDGLGTVSVNFRIDGASKNGTGNAGFADLVWLDDFGVIHIWEVKSVGQAGKAAAEAYWYADAWNSGTRRFQAASEQETAEPGFAIPGLPVETGYLNDVVNNVPDGGLVYQSGPTRQPPAGRSVPVEVGSPVRVPALSNQELNSLGRDAGVLGAGLLAGGLLVRGGALGGGLMRLRMS